MNKFPDVCKDGRRSFDRNRERLQINRKRTVSMLQIPEIFIFGLSLAEKSNVFKRKYGEIHHKCLFSIWHTEQPYGSIVLFNFLKFILKK